MASPSIQRSPSPRHAIETNDRLLAAAAEVFAEVGYRGATLREICRRAQANIAAVNYHFRDKEQLYAAVLDRAVAAAGDGLAQIAPPADAPPEEKLRQFIQRLMHTLLGAERPVQLLKLVAHEMVQPTPALQDVVERAARPLNQLLAGVVRELLGAEADPVTVRECVSSVMTQCSGYHHSEALIRCLHQLDVHDPATIQRLADHIFRFSLGGIRAAAGGQSPGDAGGHMHSSPLTHEVPRP